MGRRRDSGDAPAGRGASGGDAARRTVDAIRRSLAGKVAEAIRRDPDRHAKAIELGIIDPDWLDSPADRPISALVPLQKLEEFLIRSVEERPALIARLDLSALDLLGRTAAVLPGGRRTTAPITVLFTDLEGFTAYTEREGDDAAGYLLDDHYRTVVPVVRSRGGRIVKRLGDGLMLSFVDPVAASFAALDLIEIAPEPLRLRAGAHHGDAMVSRDDVVGHVVNVAARVAEAADGGDVLVTSSVKREAGEVEGLVYGKLKHRRFKGLDEPISVCDLRRAPRR